jgi:hypothetical protein
VFHDAAQDRRLENLPIPVGRLGDGDEIGPEKHALDAFDRKQPFGQRRRDSSVRGRKIHRPFLHDHAAGEKFQGRRIGRLLGLDKQTYLRVECVAVVRSASLRLGTGRLHPHSMPIEVGTGARAIKLILDSL